MRGARCCPGCPTLPYQLSLVGLQMLSAALGVARIKDRVRELILVARAIAYSLANCGTVIRRFSQFLFAQRKLVEYHNDSVALPEPHSLLTETNALPAG